MSSTLRKHTSTKTQKISPIKLPPFKDNLIPLQKKKTYKKAELKKLLSNNAINSEDNNSENQSTTTQNYSYYRAISKKCNKKKLSSRKAIRKHTLSIEDKLKLQSLIKNFTANKIATRHLFQLEKVKPINILTSHNYNFLSAQSDKKFKNLKNSKSQFSTSSKMINQFNKKVSKIWINSERNTTEGRKFSRNVNTFRNQIISSYNDKEPNMNNLSSKDKNKSKLDYNNALGILEENDEKKILNTERYMQEFYKKKYEHSDYPINLKTFYSMNTLNSILSKKDKKMVKKKFENEQERIIHNCLKNHAKYNKNLFKYNSKIYADSFIDINSMQYEPLTEQPTGYSTLNYNNLARVMKVNSINKKLFYAEDDVLLQRDHITLKKLISKTEEYYYYTIGKSKYKLTFLRDKFKPSTVAKLNMMKNAHFGIPV